MGSDNPHLAVYSETAASPNLDQQQIQFADSNPGDEVTFTSSSVSTFDASALEGMSLGDFLQRPVLIDTFDWGEGGFASHGFDPWTLFFTDPAIKRKMDNYGLVRCKLHLKFMLSASPFYYGMCMVSYNPMPDYHPSPQVVVASDEALVTYSQRPHILLWPSKSQGGGMELPFFYPENWHRNRGFSFSDLGYIRYESPDVLRNANSAAGANVTIRCYAWASDVELAQPTLQLQGRSSKVKFQKSGASKRPTVMDRVAAFSAGRDEYDGPVSSVASAVANASKELKAVPIIGPMARATEIGAGAISRIAAWFGYTNVPVISDVQPFKDLPFGGFANSSIGTPTAKLTLDPKNELTIDSRTVGLDGTDELSLESFCTRPSYLYTFDWDTTNAPDSVLMGQLVAPSLIYRETLTQLWPTPMSHAANMYQYWSGSIIFTFHIICTPYHRGRIKIVFEPTPVDFAFTTPDDTVQISKIVDIGETQEVEICVPFMQAIPFLPNFAPQQGRSRYALNATLGALSSTNCNGTIFVQVANELTSPVANAPVQVAVFARAGEDFKLMGPKGPPNSLEWVTQGRSWDPNESLELQGDSWDAGEGEMCMGQVNTSEPDLNLVFGGETALSLRQICQRHSYVRSTYWAGGNTEYRSHFHLYPYSLNTTSDARNIHATTGASRYNYVNNTPVAWLAPCFAGMRGSMHWAYVPRNGEGVVTLTRAPNYASLPTEVDQTITPLVAAAPNSASYNALLGNNGFNNSGAGSAVYNLSTQTGSTACVPFISNQRFVGTFPLPWSGASTMRPYMSALTIVLDEETSVENVDTDEARFYCAAGPDFNVFFFSGIPTMRYVTSIPDPSI